MTELIDWTRLNSPEGLTVGDLPDEHLAGARLELIDGSLIVTPLGDYAHQLTIMQLAQRLIGAPLPDGATVLAGVNVVQGQRTLVIPDLAVVDPAAVVPSGLGVAPDGVLLAVEVTSPSTRWHDLTAKRELYDRWGVPYLVIDRASEPAVARIHGKLPSYAQVLLEGFGTE